jgi:phosphoribosylformylglycinamidine synthase subunit PurL
LGFIDGEALPIISGNVSFYNESKQGQAIIPSPVIVAVGRVEDYHKVITMQLKNPGEKLILIGKRYPEFGAALINEFVSDLNNIAPQVRLAVEARQNKAVYKMINEQLISACHDISLGGLWMNLCEMILGERGFAKVGLDIQLPSADYVTELFSENGGYLISMIEKNEAEVLKILKQKEVEYFEVGQVVDTNRICVNVGQEKVLDIDIKEIEGAWNCRN